MVEFFRFGGMAEWTKATVLKTVVAQATGGSKPFSSAGWLISRLLICCKPVAIKPASDGLVLSFNPLSAGKWFDLVTLSFCASQLPQVTIGFNPYSQSC